MRRRTRGECTKHARSVPACIANPLSARRCPIPERSNHCSALSEVAGRRKVKKKRRRTGGSGRAEHGESMVRWFGSVPELHAATRCEVPVFKMESDEPHRGVAQDNGNEDLAAVPFFSEPGPWVGRSRSFNVSREVRKARIGDLQLYPGLHAGHARPPGSDRF